MFLEFERYGCARRLGLIGIDSAGAAAHTGNLNMLVPLGFLFWAAVDFKVNRLLLENDVGNLNAVAELGGGAIGLRHPVELRVARLDHTIGRNRHVLFAYRKIFAYVNKLGVHNPNELHFGAISQLLPVVEIYWLQVRGSVGLGLRLGIRRLGGM